MSYKQQVPGLASKEAEPSSLGLLEVNVIFTDARASRAVLQAATRLAAKVPFPLPLDHPQVSVPFTQEVVFGLVSEFEQYSLDIPAHLYLSRNRIEAFFKNLQPNSLVVIAGRKRPTPESRIVKRLQSEGHRVVFIPFRGGNECGQESLRLLLWAR